MKMKSRTLAIIILVTIFGGIALTTALGWWETANVRTPASAEKDYSVESDHSDKEDHKEEVSGHEEETDSHGEEGHEEEGGDHGTSFINGQTTFWQALQAGASEERIIEILGVEKMPNSAMTVKDYCLQNDLPFSTIKKALQAEMDDQ